jgi:uncharacterized protein YkwD
MSVARCTPRIGAMVVSVALLATVAAAGAGAAASPQPPVPPLPDPLAGLVAPLLPPTDPAPPSQAPSEQAAAAQAPTLGTAVTATRVLTALQRSVVAEINIVRRSQRLPRLGISTQLIRAGQEHARALAGLFSHSWSDGSPFGSWIRRFYPVSGARTWRVGENLAWSATAVTAHQAVEMWLASPTHRRILLGKHWRQVGIGVVQADGARGVYAGQSVVILAAEFGLRR